MSVVSEEGSQEAFVSVDRGAGRWNAGKPGTHQHPLTCLQQLPGRTGLMVSPNRPKYMYLVSGDGGYYFGRDFIMRNHSERVRACQ